MNTPIKPSAEPSASPVAGAPWETLSSPGHVLYQRVSLLGARTPRLLLNLFASLILLLAALWVVASMRDGESRVVASLAGRVQAWLATGTPAPIVATPHASWPGLTVDDAQALSTPDAVSSWLQSQLSTVSRGGSLAGCVDLKITAAWPTSSIGCRVSADKSRVWVWGLARIESAPGLIQIQPVLAIFRHALWTEGSAVAWQLRDVEVPGIQPLAGLQSVRWADVPRAAAADFPELAAN